MGCGSPARPTLLGPFRIWAYHKTFRSSKVKKAIARIRKMKVIKEGIIKVSIAVVVCIL